MFIYEIFKIHCQSINRVTLLAVFFCKTATVAVVSKTKSLWELIQLGVNVGFFVLRMNP